MITKNIFFEIEPNECEIIESTDENFERFDETLGYYGTQLLRITKEQMDALIKGKMLGIRVQDEYSLGIVLEENINV